LEAINEDHDLEFRFGGTSGRSVTADDDCHPRIVKSDRSYEDRSDGLPAWTNLS
jgi:hypothetical protein